MVTTAQKLILKRRVLGVANAKKERTDTKSMARR